MRDIEHKFIEYLEEEGFFYIKLVGYEDDKLKFSCFEDDFDKLYIEIILDVETKDFVVTFRPEDSNVYLIYDVVDKNYLNKDVI